MTAKEKIAEHLEHLRMLCARGKFTNKILSKSIIDIEIEPTSPTCQVK